MKTASSSSLALWYMPGKGCLCMTSPQQKPWVLSSLASLVDIAHVSAQLIAEGTKQVPCDSESLCLVPPTCLFPCIFFLPIVMLSTTICRVLCVLFGNHRIWGRTHAYLPISSPVPLASPRLPRPGLLALPARATHAHVPFWPGSLTTSVCLRTQRPLLCIPFVGQQPLRGPTPSCAIFTKALLSPAMCTSAP